MKCQICSLREASAHLIRIVHGKKEDYYLCDQCLNFQKDIINLNMNFDLNVKDFISGLFTEMVKVGKKEQNNLKIICSECGTTFEEFTKTGKLGCSKCYNTFKNKLVVLLKKIQGNIKHNGKVPKRTGGEIKRKREIESLEAEMSQEILKQNFEKAAIIRDKLKEIRKEEN